VSAMRLSKLRVVLRADPQAQPPGGFGPIDFRAGLRLP
jgi:hypothetical protein